MVPKEKDRASGGAAIGVASIGVSGQAAFSGILVVASILINWNYPLLLPFQTMDRTGTDYIATKVSFSRMN